MEFRCSLCKGLKIRLPHPTTPKLFVDENGRFWNARACPTCKNAQIRKYMAKRRELSRRAKAARLAAQRVYESEQIEATPLTDRYCRGCGKNLPADKYFYHAGCRPMASVDTGSAFDEVYSGR